ncbi:MAG: hypothetical protein AB2731_09290 [Candidatus Thiodiazotropha sp.]|nr:hypothetical protein [Candidatus Thiodiazotropha sp. (ex Codakia orbicularis)]
MSSESTRICPSLTGCLLVGICAYGTVYAVDPGYIAAVEADVAEFKTNEFIPPADSGWLGSLDSESPQLMDLEGFSVYLQQKSPGSYIFYEKLSMEFKQRLHEDYLATGDLDRIKQAIFKFTREMKK